MTIRLRVAARVAAAGLFAVASRSAAQAPAADLILTRGTVVTPTGTAAAMAVRSGVIVAVGDAATVAVMRGPRTKLIDLGGATVLPGLHDVHVHPIYGGITERRCKIPQGSSLSETQRLLKGCAAKLAPGEWLIGGQWDAPALGGIPNRQALDAAVADRPVLLDDTSGHSVWANSRAIKAAGITRDTPNPTGGIIEREASGEPTGIFRESANALIRSRAPRASAATLQSALLWSVRQMLAVGITSFTEASLGFVGGDDAEVRAYANLADQGLLKQRVTLCLGWNPSNPSAERFIANRNLYARPRIAPNCVKLFLDGVPTDGHTAAMLDPYADAVAGRAGDDGASRGMLLLKQDVLDSAVTRFDRMGLTIKFHAAGDAAVRAGIDAIAAARRVNGWSGLMHHVGHCTFVSKEDIARARSIGATFEVSPYLWGPSPINDAITAAVGAPRIDRVWPVREMLDAGALVVPGSDWSVVPSVNPWIGIETLVTRQAPGGSATSFGVGEAITLPEAMTMFTANAARQERRADRVGRLEVGMLADVIVVDQNPYRIEPTKIHSTKVRMTFIEGEKVYDAASAR